MTNKKKIPAGEGNEGYRPTGLKGKDIGLFYRDMKRAKNAEEAAKIAETYEKKAAASGADNFSGLTKRQRRAQRFLEQQLRKKQQQKSTIVSCKYSFSVF